MGRKRFKVEKLIRDRLLQIIRNNGIEVHKQILDSVEYLSKLKNKLLEEAKEVNETKNSDDLIEELADVLEVVQSIARAANIEMTQIENVREAKRESLGGFEEKIFCSWVDMEEDHPSVQYYQQKGEEIPSESYYYANCVFCQMASGIHKREILESFTHCFVVKDAFPVSLGHVLIIPKEHTENWFTAKEEVRYDILQALDVMKNRLDQEFSPEGYNLGANCGEVAGQTVMHLHFHLIPRYGGDMSDPKGGIRGVIPEKQKYG
jgi:diadenosine tetraphosphate (Ap4A) HIT family hydrolase